tara:strand:- start:104 stop:622 length:519 start_codon:yes stop_codon:yes gene_type:complete
MIITFQLEQKDYKKFTKFALKRACGKKNEKKSFVLNLIIWFLLAVVFMVVFQAISKKSFNFDIPTAVIVLLPFIIGAGIYLLEVLKLQKGTLPKIDGFLLSKSTIEINEDGLHASKESANSFFKWSVIESISENEGDYYLFLDNLYAIIVPGTAFTSKKQAGEFRGLIEKYV